MMMVVNKALENLRVIISTMKSVQSEPTISMQSKKPNEGHTTQQPTIALRSPWTTPFFVSKSSAAEKERERK